MGKPREFWITQWDGMAEEKPPVNGAASFHVIEVSALTALESENARLRLSLTRIATGVIFGNVMGEMSREEMRLESQEALNRKEIR
jgi:hypothetical protein